MGAVWVQVGFETTVVHPHDDWLKDVHVPEEYEFHENGKERDSRTKRPIKINRLFSEIIVQEGGMAGKFELIERVSAWEKVYIPPAIARD